MKVRGPQRDTKIEVLADCVSVLGERFRADCQIAPRLGPNGRQPRGDVELSIQAELGLGTWDDQSNPGSWDQSK